MCILVVYLNGVRLPKASGYRHYYCGRLPYQDNPFKVCARVTNVYGAWSEKCSPPLKVSHALLCFASLLRTSNIKRKKWWSICTYTAGFALWHNIKLEMKLRLLNKGLVGITLDDRKCKYCDTILLFCLTPMQPTGFRWHCTRASPDTPSRLCPKLSYHTLTVLL